MSLFLPAPPPTGLVDDRAGIRWRADAGGCWHPDPCPTCEHTLPGSLPWPQLLEQRGELTPVTGDA